MTAAGGCVVSPPVTCRVVLDGLDWDGPPPVTGDLVVLEVTRPAGQPVSGPAGWTRCEHHGEPLHAWWAVLGPREPDPVFTAAGPVRRWQIRATAVAGAQLVTAEGSCSPGRRLVTGACARA